MTMVKKRVAELEGAQLDWAVAMAGEEWKTAHRYYPTMTLDPTFAGVFIHDGTDRKRCFLKPNNPMRQDPRPFCPSQEWEHGGPIIERERIDLIAPCGGSCDGKPFPWRASVEWRENVPEEGRTPLIAAMRAFVASKLGDEVEVPQ